MENKYDVLVIGCGVIGAAAAFELSKYDLKVGILEKGNDVSLGTTKANSAIIHAGFDPESGSLMAKLNVRGSELAADICEKLDVPYRRQMDVPEIGGSICSATSLSMVLLYHGEKITDIADVAWGVRDYGAGKFGNWAFNVAYAGELGYQTYIDYFDIDAIKYAVSTDHPMVCSIRVKAGQLAASGYPNYTTNGHLLCVVGYEEKNGQKWLLINDPAHPEVKAILESDFANIYRGVSYIVQQRPDTFK
jgi:hypothetical protein